MKEETKLLDYGVMQHSYCILQKLQLKWTQQADGAAVISTEERRWGTPGQYIWKKKEKKRSWWWTLKPVLWLRQVDTDVITFHGHTPTIMSDNHNIICAWCQSKGKTMFANLPKTSWNILQLATGMKSFMFFIIRFSHSLCLILMFLHMLQLYSINFYFVLHSYLFWL